MSSVSGHTAHGVERPERSRNAKAQARHRAKRKAYIEQLEQTVTKLQTALGYSPEQVSALPPPLIKIRELEQEITRLQKENDDLRRLVSETSAVRPIDNDFARRDSYGSYPCDRNDYKRRKHPDNVYMGNDQQHLTDNTRPPPLTIPQPLSHHYGNIPSSVSNHTNATHNGTSVPSSLFSFSGPTFPNTPSGSSNTSSPPFSPAQMQPSSNGHRAAALSNHTISGFSSHSHYDPIKMEDENYHSSNPHPSHYPVTSYTHTPTSATALDNWSYSSERALHR